ncbi:beta-2-microglobulin-like [Amphiprion ocellaris]|uniref:Beta-2-microglobulin n=2 Tax=Amphiprion TaxID=80969 RepID=A0A3Q1C8R0_AMPOC|nr:beta-2-microglobulin-like [Amphiprion ocellaris]
MRALGLAVVCLICFTGLSVAKDAPPEVQVYTRTRSEVGKENTLICHVKGFHPPEITIDLLKNGVSMTNSKQTDLAFDETWNYHLTKHVRFTPNKGERFACNVTHLGKSRMYDWDGDM